ncbi:MAG: ATP-binding cassette domain-containing protein, partial [Nitrospirota bacterium]
MIRFSNVFLKFDGRQVLRNISMDVPAGQTQVILGGSGCGKTTTLRLILGLLHPESGSIVINGQEIVGMSDRQMTSIRAQMAMVFQGAALFDSLTVRENVGYRLWEEGALDNEFIEQRVAESLRFVGLEDTLDKMPAELSGGMKKRVAIAR